ncbi:MAG TPA: hypothetical protein VEH04_04245 [Verrucomicrobiae bacterium]|nr:hypothetical protein [Verrucomicrobiae bacterium]
MNIRCQLSSILLLIPLLVGCRESRVEPQPSVRPDPDRIVRLHYLGKKRLGLEAGAYYFNRIWALPETERLQSQTLDKLATAPWRFFADPSSWTNAPVALLRSLLDDIVQEESFLEVHGTSNEEPQFAFAIRLSEARSGAWETNLAVVAQSLTGVWPEQSRHPRGWKWASTNSSAKRELQRLENWLVITAWTGNTNRFGSVAETIGRHGIPFPVKATNAWIEGEVDLAAVATILGRKENTAWLPGGSRLEFSVEGDGGNVISRGELDTTEPLNLVLEPWNFPTNLIREPLASFTAVRGLRSLLPLVLPAEWQYLDGILPDQLCVWTGDGSLPHVNFAIPTTNLVHEMDVVSNYLISKGNTWLKRYSGGGFEPMSPYKGVSWNGLPEVTPFIMAASLHTGFLYGGTAPETRTNTIAVSDAMLNDIVRRTNALYYDWEMTGSRIVPEIYLTQIARLALRRGQLPVDGAALTWLKALSPRMSASTTIFSFATREQVQGIRKSTVGFTARELAILADWLESPDFPFALCSSGGSATSTSQ